LPSQEIPSNRQTQSSLHIAENVAYRVGYRSCLLYYSN